MASTHVIRTGDFLEPDNMLALPKGDSTHLSAPGGGSACQSLLSA